MEKIEFKTAASHLYAVITFNEEIRCLSDTWSGAFGTQENFKKVLTKLAEMIGEVKVSKILTDVSQMTGSFDSSREWIVKENIPICIRMGLRHHAMVIPKNIFSKLSVKDYALQVEGLEIRQFGDMEEAKKWLLSFE